MRRVFTIAMLTLLLGALVPISATAQGWDPCGDALNGVYPDGYDVVYAPNQGRSGSQIVLGSDGDDYLKGGSGDDILCGYGGNDVLEGNSGDDWMDAGTGYNELYGNSGNDTLIGMEGDVFVGNSGRNKIIANTPPPPPDPEPQGSIRIEYLGIYEGHCRFQLIAEGLTFDPQWIEYERNMDPPQAGTWSYETYGDNGYFIATAVYSPERFAIDPLNSNTELWVRISNDDGLALERTITYAEDCAPLLG